MTLPADHAKLLQVMNFRLSCSLSLVLAVAGLGLAGCQLPKVVAPIGSGYQEVSHPKRGFIDEPPLPRISFEHRGADGRVVKIWPSLYGVNTVINGELAIFVGDRAYRDDGTRTTRPRLFAVQFPGLPLDITDQVLWEWARTNGKSLGQTMDHFSLITPKENSGRLELHLDFYTNDKNWPDQGELLLEWNQVTNIMQTVKSKGLVEKDLYWHTQFIGVELPSQPTAPFAKP